MLVGKVGDFTTTRSALYEPFFDEVWLINFLYSTRIFTKCSGYGGQSYGTSFELVDYRS